MPHLRRNLIAVLLAAACFAHASEVEACPGCAEAQAGQGPGRAGIVQGYQLSIVFMMAMPFLIVGSFGGYVYYSVRRAQKDSSHLDESNDENSSTSSAVVARGPDDIR